MNSTIELYTDNRTPVENETYIVFGCARGGTSMVAGCMAGLGLHMGNNLPQNYEDPEFVNRPVDEMRNTIKRKNKHHSKWGWKYPEAANYLEDVIDDVANPRLIIVFRDLVAIAKKQNSANNKGLVSSISANFVQQQKNLFVAMQFGVPTLVVSYEKAIAHNGSFLNEISSFIGIEQPEDNGHLIEFMTPGEYKSTFADRYVA